MQTLERSSEPEVKFPTLKEVSDEFSIKNNLAANKLVQHKSGYILDLGNRGLVNLSGYGPVNDSGIFDDEVTFTMRYRDTMKREFSAGYYLSGIIDGKPIDLDVRLTYKFDRVTSEGASLGWNKEEIIERRDKEPYWFLVDQKQ